MRLNKLTKDFLKGKPVELTDASAEVADLRRILEGNCLIGDYDVGGRVYWDERKAVAVCVPSILSNPNDMVYIPIEG